eukprot:PhF_6_TR25132/c0_g1_i1/m.34585
MRFGHHHHVHRTRSKRTNPQPTSQGVGSSTGITYCSAWYPFGGRRSPIFGIRITFVCGSTTMLKAFHVRFASTTPTRCTWAVNLRGCLMSQVSTGPFGRKAHRIRTAYRSCSNFKPMHRVGSVIPMASSGNPTTTPYRGKPGKHTV